MLDYALILSVLLLLAAPLLAKFVGRTPTLKSGLDGFVLVTLIALIATTLLPEALNHTGGIGLMIAILGFILPWIGEALFHKTEEMTHRIVMLIAALALVVHAASDGAILAFARDTAGGTFVASGVLLHRVGVAIAAWWLLRPILSTTVGMLVLAALGVMTVLGYFMVLLAGEWYNIPLIGYWQAFAAGSLFHVVMHPLDVHNAAPQDNTVKAHRVGTGFGVLFVIGLVVTHYWQHTPEVLPIFKHALHHDVDIIALTGQLLAPILLTVVATAAVYGRLKDSTLSAAYKSVQSAVPWTLALWLGATVTEILSPELLPVPKNGQILFAVWLAVVSGVLVHTGARVFFSGFLPKFMHHTHNHG